MSAAGGRPVVGRIGVPLPSARASCACVCVHFICWQRALHMPLHAFYMPAGLVMRAPAGQCSSQPPPAPCGPISTHQTRCGGTQACVRKTAGLVRPSLAARLASGSGFTVCCADTSQMMSLVPQLGSVTPFKLTNKVRPAVQKLQGLHLVRQL